MNKATNLRSLALAALLGLGAVSPAFAGTLTLDVVIRDFHDSHPDFQSYCCGLVPGMVGSTLGADGTPTYVGGSMMTTAANFADWYHDVPGTNTKTTKSLTLDNGLGAGVEGGVYTYDNPSFFPIDGELFGNAGYSHNYHFTLQMNTEFTYEAGQLFSFRGDDDLWVFIDNELVIDLGGIHGPATGSVALDTLGLVAGDTYSLDLFFAERHTVGSSFKIETSITSLTTVDVPEPGMLSLLGLGLLGLLRKHRQQIKAS